MFAKTKIEVTSEESGDLAMHPLSPIPQLHNFYCSVLLLFSVFVADGGSKGVMEEQKLKGRDVYQAHFVTSEENNELHKCRECSRDIKQNVTGGYANLVAHVTTQHKGEYAEKVRAHSKVRESSCSRSDGYICAEEVLREGQKDIWLDGMDCYGEPRFAELREQKFQEEDQPLMHDIKDSEEIYGNGDEKDFSSD